MSQIQIQLQKITMPTFSAYNRIPCYRSIVAQAKIETKKLATGS